MDNGRAKWDAAYARFRALDKPILSRASDLFEKTYSTHQDMHVGAEKLNRAVDLALEEADRKLFESNRRDIVVEYDEAIFGAEIISKLENTK